MSAQDLYLVCHLGASVLWVGAGFTIVLLGVRVGLANDHARRLAYARDVEWFGPRVFLPCNLLVLVFGFLLVHEAGWGYDRLWIQLGLGGLLVSFLVGALVFGPGWAQVAKLAEAEGAGSPGVAARMGRLQLAGFLDLGLLLGIVFVMTVKPGAGDWGALAVAAAIPAVLGAAGVALSRSAMRRHTETLPALGESPAE